MFSRRRVAPIVLAVSVLGACSGPELSAPTSATSPVSVEASEEVDSVPQVRRTEAVDTSYDFEGDFALLPEEGIIYAAPLVVRGVVEDVAGPFWNQRSGQKWEGSPAELVHPFMYRQVTFQVSETLRDDFNVNPSSMTVIVFGGGEKATGDSAFDGGHFQTGEEMVLMLSTQTFYMREKFITAYQPFYFNQGVFHIENNKVRPDRTQPDASGEDIGSLRDYDQFRDEVVTSREVAGSRWEPYRTSETAAQDMIDVAVQFLETGLLPDGAVTGLRPAGPVTVEDAQGRFEEMLDTFQPGDGLQIGGAVDEELGVLSLYAVHGPETDLFVEELFSEFGDLVLIEWVECLRC